MEEVTTIAQLLNVGMNAVLLYLLLTSQRAYRDEVKSHLDDLRNFAIIKPTKTPTPPLGTIPAKN